MTRKPKLTYHTIRTVALAAARSFYRLRFYRHPDAATGGPMVVVANHPNAAVDAALVAAAVDIPLHFLVKSSLFRVPALGAILRTAGALPAFRRQDGADTTKNDDMFAAARAVLETGGAVCVFPEGTSHTDAHLRQLRTGAARIALNGCAAGFAVKLQPVGVMYGNRERFRTHASATIGPALDVTAWLAGRNLTAGSFDPQDPPLVQDLTAAIAEALAEVTFTGADHTVLDLAEKLAAAETPGGDRDPGVLRAWAAELRRAHEHPERCHVMDELRVFFEHLNEAGLVPADLAEAAPERELEGVTAQLLRSAAVVPVAAYGSAAGSIPLHATHAVYQVAGKRGVGAASVKIVAAALLYPLWGLLLWKRLRRSGAGTGLAAGVLISGWMAHLAARPIWEDQGRRWHRVVLAVRLRRSAELARKLADGRRRLDELTDELYATAATSQP